jgi:diguanylate cyclase (GGDEF)-like protein
MWARPGWPDGDWLLVAVPGRWPEQGGARYRGYAWYHLHYQLDSTATEPLAVRLTSVAAAYEVFADGKRFGGVGEFPPHYRARTNVGVNFVLPAVAATRGEHVLAVRVYSNERVGGIVAPVLAGPLDALATRENRISFVLLATALLLIGVAVNLLFFWGRRPEAAEHLYLFAHIGALGLLFIIWVPPMRASLSAALDFYRLYLFFGGAAAAFLCFAFRRLFDLDQSRLATALGLVFLAVGIAGLVAPGWGELHALGTHLFSPLLLIGCAAVIVLAAQQLRRGTEHARVVLWGIGIFSVTLGHDVVREWSGIAGLGLPWVFAGAVALVFSVAFVTTRKIVETATIALYDRLTGLYRREVVLDALKREIRRAARTREPLALIMLDLDHFKAVNDSLGHQAGDRVLAEVGRRLAEAGRAVDWLGRYGGEEFLGILAGSDADGARQAAERFRSAVAALPIDVGRAPRAVTISAGIAAYDGGAEWPTVETLVGAADAALYRAKEGGRNQVRT